MIYIVLEVESEKMADEIQKNLSESVVSITYGISDIKNLKPFPSYALNRIKEMMESNSISNDKIIEKWNELCEAHGYEEFIFINNSDAINERMEGYTPSEVISHVSNDYNTNDDYAYISNIGYLESFNDLFDEKSPINLPSLLKFMSEECESINDLMDLEE